jgi:cytochrome c biogenesis protein CcmG/thiol:disulfide interchange protein DsbE
MNRITTTLILFSLAFGAAAQNGQTMPEIVLKDLNGKNKNVAEYSKAGKIVIINFWATWCTPCKKELNNIHETLYETWKNEYNVELVAISIDDSRNVLKVKPYVAGQGWEYEVLLDVNRDLLRALNGQNVPYTIILDKTGKVVWSHNGYIEGDEFKLQEKLKELAGK